MTSIEEQSALLVQKIEKYERQLFETRGDLSAPNLSSSVREFAVGRAHDLAAKVDAMKKRLGELKHHQMIGDVNASGSSGASSTVYSRHELMSMSDDSPKESDAQEHPQLSSLPKCPVSQRRSPAALVEEAPPVDGMSTDSFGAQMSTVAEVPVEPPQPTASTVPPRRQMIGRGMPKRSSTSDNPFSLSRVDKTSVSTTASEKEETPPSTAPTQKPMMGRGFPPPARTITKDGGLFMPHLVASSAKPRSATSAKAQAPPPSLPDLPSTIEPPPSQQPVVVAPSAMQPRPSSPDVPPVVAQTPAAVTPLDAFMKELSIDVDAKSGERRVTPPTTATKKTAYRNMTMTRNLKTDEWTVVLEPAQQPTTPMADPNRRRLIDWNVGQCCSSVLRNSTEAFATSLTALFVECALDGRHVRDYINAKLRRMDAALPTAYADAIDRYDADGGR